MTPTASPQTRRRRRTPSPATVIAIAALVVALGGTATAARTLITSNDIAVGAVKARHIAPNAVTLAKIAAPARVALRGAAGPVGIPGPAGAPGASGPAGGFDLAKISRIVGPETTIPPGELGSALATCPAGHKVTGGGFVSIGADQTIFASAPSVDGTTWIVLLDNFNATVTNLTGSAYALCVAP